jgi:Tfp pilus assembly PilM family ATPase
VLAVSPALARRLKLRRLAFYWPVINRIIPPTPVGVVLTEGRVRIVALEPAPGRDQSWVITACIDEPVPEGHMRGEDVVDVRGITELLGRIFETHQLDMDNVVLSTGWNAVFLRRGQTDRRSNEDLLSNLPNIKKLTMDAKDPGQKRHFGAAVLDPSEISDQMNVLAGTGIHDWLMRRQKAAREAGLMLHSVSPEAVGLYNAYRLHERGERGKALVLYIGAEVCVSMLCDALGPIMIRIATNRGVNTVLNDLISRGGVTQESPEEVLYSGAPLINHQRVTEGWVGAIADECRRLLMGAGTGGKGGDGGTADIPIYLTGDGAQIPGIATKLNELTTASCQILNPIRRFGKMVSPETDNPSNFGPYAVALGLAARLATFQGSGNG